jgi:hypothetical protein
MKRTAFILTILSAMHGRAQWAPLPAATPSYSTPVSYTADTRPGTVVPFDDNSIVYTWHYFGPTPSSSSYATIVVSTDDLATRKGVYDNPGMVTLVNSYDNKTLCFFKSYMGNWSFHYTDDGMSTFKTAGGCGPMMNANSITGKYIYSLSSLNQSNNYAFCSYRKSNNATNSSTVAPAYGPASAKLHFLNDSVGFRLASVSPTSSVYKVIGTQDYGSSWTTFLTDSTDVIVDYQVSQTGYIYLLKASGGVMRSSQIGIPFGSLTFTPLTNLPPGPVYNCLRFIDNLTGFAGGTGGALYKTTDGGMSWVGENSNTSLDIQRFYAFTSKMYFVTTNQKVFTNSKPVGVGEVRKDMFRIFPNPANGQFTLQFDKARLSTVTISDVFGKKLRCVTVNDPQNVISLGGLTAGIYFVSVETAEGTSTQRIIKSE